MQADKIEQVFGNRTRLRVCGLCWQNNKLLLIKHKGLGPNGVFYAPPGGEIEFGNNLQENLIREFLEETGLQVSVGNFKFLHEYLQPPLHAIELFFDVKIESGELCLGNDPELDSNEQIIEHALFYNWQKIKQIEPRNLHQSLRNCKTAKELKELKGQLIFDL